MAIELTDDGTMDTVLRCSECGEEMRYNFAMDAPDWPNTADEAVAAMHDDQAAYDAFVASCIEDATAEHVCNEEEL